MFSPALLRWWRVGEQTVTKLQEMHKCTTKEVNEEAHEATNGRNMGGRKCVSDAVT